jgi:hypothetical protein
MLTRGAQDVMGGFFFLAAHFSGPMRVRRPLLVVLACGLCLACSGAGGDWDGQTYRKVGEAFPDGSWRVEVVGPPTRANPGDTLEWTVRFAMKSSAVRDFAAKIDEIKLALAARRVCDAEGHYRDQNGYFTSTYLTPSGLPIEGYQYLIANSRIGGPYRTPLDIVQDVPRAAIRIAGDSLSFTLPVKAPLGADFPAGLFRIELAFYASVDGHWLPLHALGAADPRRSAGCDPDYEIRYFYRKIFLPPLRVGDFRQPRLIWTLFGAVRSNGVSGVVAQEDAPFFAMSNRFKPQTRYVLPCTPDRQTCQFAIAPDLPTLRETRPFLFHAKEYLDETLELDFHRGEVAVQVKRPDGGVDDLGRHGFTGLGEGGPTVQAPGTGYRFDWFGRYEIRMTGEMYDRFGNRFEAGGTYEVWVAYPLTFATAIKPGTPLRVGDSYPVAATINPPVPASVTATVRFYPGLHPHDLSETVYAGAAQRFGYFYPAPTQQPFVFPEQGEYLYDIFAVWTDPNGRVYMGNMRNASVVIANDDSLAIFGGAQSTIAREHDSRRAFNDLYSQFSNVFFPRESGGIYRFFGNSLWDQTVNPNMSAEEPSGYLQRILERSFPPGLVKLHNRPGEERYAAAHGIVFPGSQEMMRAYGRDYGSGKSLPLISTAAGGYSPFEYPELVDRRGYFYIAASRPGFPVYFVVASSTINENYWYVGASDYGGTIGAAKRGDQPGDIIWSVVAGLFADPPANREFYGAYGAAGVAAPRGDFDVFDKPATMPVASVNGVDFGIFAGVGPSPGTMYETGAVKGVGSIAIPMAPHDVEIRIRKPDGQTMECRGRADRLGNFFCPDGSLVFDRAGVYRVYAHFSDGDRVGGVPGARAGWHQVYAVAADTPYRVLFRPPPPRRPTFESPIVVDGQVSPSLRVGRAYYSIVAPGILIDEGAVDLIDSRFRLTLSPDQITAEFANLHDHPAIFSMKLGGYAGEAQHVGNLLAGHTRRVLSDTIEITVFVEGVGANGDAATAGGKFILRGDRALIPAAFLAGDREAHR